ncbi:hypothetical protein D9758_001103 [Tetrapyrgos nigripes]|uniref:Uncharacterized protein n=1 Tax=Tetrapyrgos nigripes TaxID=182062 RepID=A0A8H5GSE2_9AGAR|nr:hypothetical protein D9758_001103 [Tetrapyrgos nigripes]
MPSVLFAYTSVDKSLKGGWYLPEAAHPYYVLKDFASIDFAALKGPNPPIGQGQVGKRQKGFHVYLPRWRSVIDLAEDPVNIKLVSEASKITAAERTLSSHRLHPYHYVVMIYRELVNAIDKDGLLEKRSLSPLPGQSCISLEDKIKALGIYKKASELLGEYVVIDGHLLTGQNPSSAGPIGKAIKEALGKELNISPCSFL